MGHVTTGGLSAHQWVDITGIFVAGAACVLGFALHKIRSRFVGLQRIARRRGMRLVELMRLVSMAESSAHFGVWHYFPGDQRQEWSGGMKELFGLERDTELLEGDAETLLAANEIDLVGKVAEQSVGHDVISSRFVVRRWDGSRRILQFQTCHLGDGKGELDRIVGVLADVTELQQQDEIRGIGSPVTPIARIAAAPVELVERRDLMAQLDRHVAEFRKTRTPVSLLLIELGGGARLRKAVTDKLCGEFSAVTREHMRSRDVLGRLSGTEFAWLVAGADEHYADLVVERLKCAFVISGLGGFLGDDSFAIGAASARDRDTSLSLFARADGSLARAKKKSILSLSRVA